MVLTTKSENVIITDKRTPAEEEKNSHTYDVAVIRRRKREKHKKELSGIEKRNRTKDKTEENDRKRQIRSKQAAKRTGGKIRNRVKDNVEDTVNSATGTDDSEYSNQRDFGSVENTGLKREKKTAKIAIKAILTEIILFLKAVVTVMTNMVVLVAVVTVFIVIVAVVTVRNITYGMIADEEPYVREDLSQITSELSAELTELKDKYGCYSISTEGDFIDTKAVIAFWWTLKNNTGNTSYWDSFITGDDKNDLAYVFYEFNEVRFETDGVSGYIDHRGVHIEEEVITPPESADTGGKPEKVSKKVLKVTISHRTIDEMCTRYRLSESQIQELKEMLEDEELWEELLGTSELSQYAARELNCSGTKYQDYYGKQTDTNLLFVEYCMEKTGLLSETYMIPSENVEGFRKQCIAKGFYKPKGMYIPKEGSVIFLSYNGGSKIGIVSKVHVENKIIEVIIAGYNKELVEEISLNSTTQIVEGYAYFGDIYVEALSSMNGAYSAGSVTSPRIKGTDTELTYEEVHINRYYTSVLDSPFSGDIGLDRYVGDRGGNCTAYAWGRRCELEGDITELNPGAGNADDWFNDPKNQSIYRTGQTPEVGAVCCWDYGPGSSGHVAIIEVINEDGSIVTSNSGYSTRTLFYTEIFANEQALRAKYKIFQGYIYLDKINQTK